MSRLCHRLSLAVLISLLFAAHPASALTTISGSINSDTIWTSSNSPYYVTSSVTVASGVTLTIEAGTTVKFAQGQGLYVNGTLTAIGLPGLQINFTDYRDDNLGGDTNGDGSATTPSPGWWRSIEIGNGGSASFDYCRIRYAGSANANIHKAGAGALTVTNSQITGSVNHGIYLNGATSASTISNSTIGGNVQHGVYAAGDSPATVSGSTISNNGKYGIYASVAVPSTFTVNSNTFSGNLTAPVGVTAASSGIAVGSANSGLIYILVEGGSGISSNQWWGTSGAALVYYLTGSMTIDMGRTLAVQPNTVIKGAPGVYIHVNGSLDARSTSGNEIVFTEFRDDSAGGDSNGDGTATTPAPGGWRGIEIYDNGSALFDYCRIRYAGSSYANIYKTGANGSVSISNSQISSSVNHGIYLNGAATASTITGSTVSGNLQHGIYANSTSPAAVSGSTINNNGRYGVYASVATPSTFTVSGNSFSGNLAAPTGVTAASSGIAISSSNSGLTHVLVESGSVSSTQSWGISGASLTYYLTGGVSIDAGRILTILPGTVVKSVSGVSLNIYGTLAAVATSGNEIVFTEIRDDSAGGDTNGDGAATLPVPGGWRGIEVYDNGSATIDYCRIRYAGSTYANVYKTGANGSVSISNSQISSSINHGIYLNGAATTSTVTGSTVSGNLQHGIYAVGSSPASVSGSSISMNTLYGVYANVTNPAAFSLSGNTFVSDKSAPIGVAAASSGIAIAASNTFTGRKHVHVEGGTIAGSQGWGNGSTIVYYISDNITINANQTLTVQPNTVIKFFADRALFFNGSLNAAGSAGNPIYFTDYRDDVGGDTNMDGTATSPVPGGWRGIELNNYAGATLDYCVLRYGGSASGQQAILYKTGEGAVSISSSTVSDAAYRGISLIGTTSAISVTSSIIRDNAAYNFYLSGSGTTPVITRSQISGSNIGIYATSSANPLVGGSTENGNDIFDNVTYSVQNASTSPTINATFNWWGASDGAKTTGINKVSSYVDTGSYLTASVFSNTPFTPAPPKTVLGDTTYGSGTTTWTLANSPYYINGDVTVNPGATLSIEPGVIIKFAQYRGLHINGTLAASGTAGSGRIYFTDYRDDTAGGDTNGDGSATDPAPGWWRGILVNDGGVATISNAVVRYGGSSGPNSSNVYKTGASGSLTISDSVISYSFSYGLYLNNASATSTIISGSSFSYNNADGILAGSNSPASITGCSFTGNGRYGIYASVSNPTAFQVSSGNSFTYNGSAPIGATAASAGIVVTSGNSFTGTNYILVEEGAISVSQTWGSGHPYYYLAGNVTVNAGPTLAIGPGTIIKFTQYVGLHINGILKAEGTSGSRITFTDFRDDTVGGDTNGDGSATVPAPGWWRGILVNDGAYATIAYSDIRYGGHAGPNSSNLYKTGANGTLTVTDSTLSHSSAYGLYLNNASTASTIISGSSFSYNNADGILAGSNSPASITGCSFTGNGRYGIYASVSNPAAFQVSSGNSFTYNATAPIGVTAASAGIVVAAGNSFTGSNYIRIEDGSISGNQTWGNGHPYYLVGSVTVPAGLTLTVKPGSVLKFPQDIGLWVNGTLDAQGTGVNKIYFTDGRDDAAGGDNNGDGAATAPATGWWRGVNIQDGGSALIDYCVIRYGGRRDPGYANLYKTGAGSLAVNHSEFGYSGNHGIYLGNATGTVNITGSTFSTSVYDGIYADRASTSTISGNTFTGNGRWGIYAAVSNPAGIVVSGNSFSYNTLAPIGVSAAGSGIAVAADNVFTGRSYIYVEDGSIAGNPTWGNGSGASYYLAGNVTVPPGLTLTISPGTVVKFTQNVGLHINGTLSAAGTALDRIYFSDIRDDESGGDTNADGAATVPSPGWWRGILVNSGGSATIAFSVIRYGGSSGPNSSNVYKTGSGTFTLSNSLLSDSIYYGLHLSGASAGSNLSANTYRNNGYDGIYATGNSPYTDAGSLFIGNFRYGVYSDAASTAAVSISGGTFTSNASTPIRLTAVGSGAVVSDDTSFSGPLVVEGGTIGSSLAWANNRIYYIVGNITAATGATLSVSPGLIVKFAQDTGLFISGSLSAVGTSGSRIYFTDYRDDTVGGDTNADGTASAPASAWWYGLHFNDGGSGVIDYATVRYARSGSYGWPYYNSFAGVYKTGTGNLSVTNSTIENANNYGIWLVSSSGVQTVSSNIVSNNGSHGILVQSAGTSVTVSSNTVTASGTGNTGAHGIYLENTPAAVSGNTVSGSGGYGLYITGVALPASVVLNTLNGNGLGGVGMAADSSGAVIDANNTFTGPIHVEGGSLTRDTSWVNERVYYLRGTVTVNGSRTLTVPAGRIVKFAQTTGLWVYGSLNAAGTSGSRIYFTDYRDDTIGGDTNGDGTGTVPGPSWWYGVIIKDGGNGMIDYATIRYTFGGSYGWPYYDSFAGVYKTGAGSLTLGNSAVEFSSGYGVWLTSASGTISVNSSTFRNNGSYGIVIENSGSIISVTGNTFEYNAHSGLYVGNSSPLILGNIMRYNANYGIYAYGASMLSSVFKNTIFSNSIGIYCESSANPLIGGSADNGNSIFGNTNFGVQNTTAAIQINATYNWWGTSTGPYHPSLNPLGTGNRISDYVDFGQFIANPAVPIAMEQVVPASKAFGHVTTGTVSAAQVFTVTNNGTQNLDFTSIAIAGTNAGQFRVTQNLCEGQTLATGSSCTISAVYAPTVSGPAQAQLTIVSNDIYYPTQAIPLTGAGSIILPFRDDFTSGNKSSDWFIINQEPATYNLTDNLGNLRIYTTATNFWGATNNAKNLFVVALPSSINRYAATTKMQFPNSVPTWTPSQNYQQGGVMLMAEKNGAPDLDNYMRAQYAYDGGRRFETSYDIDSAPGGYTGGVLSGITSSTPVWIRIIRQATEFRADYSLDGINYTLITAMVGPWNIAYAGLNAINGDQSSAPSIPVDFDYFELYELPSVTAVPQSAAFGDTPVGSSSPSQPFVISNNGPGQLTVSSITVNGIDPGMFSVSNGTCGTMPSVVDAGTSCTIYVMFTPSSEGAKFANVALATNDITAPVTNLSLSGTGKPLYPLTISISGNGSGSVNSDADFSCTAGTCQKNFVFGSLIELYATSSTSSNFSGWSGACGGTGSCQVTIDGNNTAIANFSLKTYTFTSTGGAGGGITPLGATIFNHGSNLTYVVTPELGYHIQNVMLDGNIPRYVQMSTGANSFPFINLSGDHVIEASFAANTAPGSGLVRILRSGVEYQTLQDAYNEAIDGDIIQLRSGILNGPMFGSSHPISVTIKGGYDSDFNEVTRTTTSISRQVLLWDGTIRMDRVVVR